METKNESLSFLKEIFTSRIFEYLKLKTLGGSMQKEMLEELENEIKNLNKFLQNQEHLADPGKFFSELQPKLWLFPAISFIYLYESGSSLITYTNNLIDLILQNLMKSSCSDLKEIYEILLSWNGILTSLIQILLSCQTENKPNPEVLNSSILFLAKLADTISKSRLPPWRNNKFLRVHAHTHAGQTQGAAMWST